MKLVNLVKVTEAEGREIYLSESIIKDADAIRDVYLTLENNYKTVEELELYGESLEKKISKGAFNYGLALKGIRNIIDKNIKSEYMKKFCSHTNINNFLDIDDRIYLYIYFLEDLIEEARDEKRI